jgi:hypothetical protein
MSNYKYDDLDYNITTQGQRIYYLMEGLRNSASTNVSQFNFNEDNLVIMYNSALTNSIFSNDFYLDMYTLNYTNLDGIYNEINTNLDNYLTISLLDLVGYCQSAVTEIQKFTYNEDEHQFYNEGKSEFNKDIDRLNNITNNIVDITDQKNNLLSNLIILSGMTYSGLTITGSTGYTLQIVQDMYNIYVQDDIIANSINNTIINNNILINQFVWNIDHWLKMN